MARLAAEGKLSNSPIEPVESVESVEPVTLQNLDEISDEIL
jgi:hypothetical protein